LFIHILLIISYDGNAVGSFNAHRDKSYSGWVSLKGGEGPPTVISSEGIISGHNEGPIMYGYPSTSELLPTANVMISFGNSYEVAGAWLAVNTYLQY
jgi:hypothetical protein